MLTATRSILETITRDPTTERVRSIKPGEDAVSMWDGLDKTAKAYTWSPDLLNDGEGENWQESFMASYTYTEADEIEDALLFPYEATGEMADNLFRNDPSAMEIFEKESIDIHKFAVDLDTDDEDYGSEDDDYSSEMDEEAIQALEPDDGDSEWGSDEEFSDDDSEGGTFITAEEHDAIDETIDALAAQMKKMKMREPDYFLPIICNPAAAKGIPDAVKNNPANLMHALRNALRCSQEYDSSPMGIESDFFRHMDRQKSKGMLCSLRLLPLSARYTPKICTYQSPWNYVMQVWTCSGVTDQVFVALITLFHHRKQHNI